MSLIDWKPVLRDHVPGLPHDRVGCQAFAVFIRARLGGATAPTVLVEQIGGEGDLVARPAAQQIARRLSHRPADEIEARDLDRGVRARTGVQRVLARHPVRLRAVAEAVAFAHRQERRADSVRVGSDDAGPQRLEHLRVDLAAVRLADPDDAVVAFQLQDRPERHRGVEAVRASERWIGDRDRMNAHRDNLHGFVRFMVVWRCLRCHRLYRA